MSYIIYLFIFKGKLWAVWEDQNGKTEVPEAWIRGSDGSQIARPGFHRSLPIQRKPCLICAVKN